MRLMAGGGGGGGGFLSCPRLGPDDFYSPSSHFTCLESACMRNSLSAFCLLLYFFLSRVRVFGT